MEAVVVAAVAVVVAVVISSCGYGGGCDTLRDNKTGGDVIQNLMEFHYYKFVSCCQVHIIATLYKSGNQLKFTSQAK